MPQPLPVHIPYCGLPPSPALVWTRWNLDPVLITGLVAVTCLYVLGVQRMARSGNATGNRSQIPPGHLEQAAFHLGWATAALALISPLCPLSVSLFAARCAQDMILSLIAAPLVMVGRPFAVLTSMLGRDSTTSATPSSPLLAAAAFAVVLWFWHAPGPYAATFASTTVYWLMHFTMFGSALWLWAGLLDRTPKRVIPVIGASIFSSVQMGFIGAVIVFAPRPLYTPYLITTRAWGLTQLQDQQLGGAIMWVPGCVIFFVVAMVVLWLVLERMETAGASRRSTRSVTL